jgi:hypothetical protein
MFRLEIHAHDSFNMGIHTRAIPKDQLIVVEFEGGREIKTGALDWLARVGIELFCGACGVEITRSVQREHACHKDVARVENLRQRMLRQHAGH